MKQTIAYRVPSTPLQQFAKGTVSVGLMVLECSNACKLAPNTTNCIGLWHDFCSSSRRLVPARIMSKSSKSWQTILCSEQMLLIFTCLVFRNSRSGYTWQETRGINPTDFGRRVTYSLRLRVICEVLYFSSISKNLMGKEKWNYLYWFQNRIFFHSWGPFTPWSALLMNVVAAWWLYLRWARRWEVLPYTLLQPGIWQICCFFSLSPLVFLQQ